MKTITSKDTKFAGLKPALLIAVALTLSLTAPAWAGGDRNKHEDRPEVVRPNERYQGRSYAEWSAATLKWAIELPLAGHPAIDSPDFDVSAGQSGNVWFLGGPFGTVERTSTIPRNKALFISLANVEVSTLEAPPFYGATEADQRAQAQFFADHIVTASLACIIDGVAVRHLDRYRVSSPQFDFTAPTPWIFGDIGGSGLSVGDGYYVMVEPLCRGQHTIHFEALFHFDAGEVPEFGPDPLDLPINMTYHLTVK